MSIDSSNEPASPAGLIGQDSAAWDALVAELGPPGAPDPSTNWTLAREVVRVLRQVRGFIAEAMHRDRVGVRELARRVGIAPSAASRIMRSDNDMYISTAVRLAAGLGKKIDIRLIDDTLSAHNRPQYRLQQVVPTAKGGTNESGQGKIAQPAGAASQLARPNIVLIG